MNIEFRDSGELDQAIERLALASKKTLREVIPRQARLFATDLAEKTRPYGNDAAGQQKGQDKIAGRISEIYKPIGWAVEIIKAKSSKDASAFERHLRRKDYAAASTLLNSRIPSGTQFSVGPFDGGKLHKGQANMKKASRALVVTGSFRAVESYTRTIQKLVGFAKGGFASAARDLGGVRGIPGYASRHKSPGRGIITENGSELSVTIENNVEYIEDAYDKKSESKAIESRVQKINKEIDQIAERNLRAATRHIT